eukprot:gnl/MRDRNA2_/MRDRNA2_1052535_c0_seq1.p2 gnl/MRDRNA2_/MRDRNA2_1052535_c0~~gnl/MRDRNA2_/MRDRNA2_1052535_c0_seq1.p2  ORF type:complete len:103 (-),score=9.07 gnl/MRDRNA2_/MRDRNA2_1052535_c0_seq1:13-291(-)
MAVRIVSTGSDGVHEACDAPNSLIISTSATARAVYEFSTAAKPPTSFHAYFLGICVISWTSILNAAFVIPALHVAQCFLPRSIVMTARHGCF